MTMGTFILKCFLLLNGQPLSNQELILCDQSRYEALEIKKTDDKGYVEFLIPDSITGSLDVLARVMNDTLAVFKYAAVDRNATMLRINITSGELHEVSFFYSSTGDVPDSLQLLIAADSIKDISRTMQRFFIASGKPYPRMSAFSSQVHKNDTLTLKMIPGSYRVYGRTVDEASRNDIHRTMKEYKLVAVLNEKKTVKELKHAGFVFNVPGDHLLRLMLEQVH